MVSVYSPASQSLKGFVPSTKAGTGTLLFCFPLGESIQGREIAAASSQHTSETCSEDTENEDSNLPQTKRNLSFLSSSISSIWSEA